ncbi:hypothetical protein [Methylocaldum szegediense]|uniref:Uncharacterized protein n=1 Tax=Methylocaldum szegediense TaxID=73780 RepID=A0ABM9I9T4_9GAMM|nr:hypothetical protein [Methylocaldum szegediense]CAI8981727.1 conserved protein of unknown function [Methylocaldum szegediense]
MAARERKQPAPVSSEPVQAGIPAAAQESRNVVALHGAPASPLDLPTEVFRAGLDRRKANRAALMEWIRSALVEGTDYGRIHTASKQKCQLAAHGRAHECADPRHWSKPSLWKPGAEKICGMLGVSVTFPTLHDYEQAALRGVDLKHVIIRCEIRDASGRVVADGVGARGIAQDCGDLNKALKMAEKSAHIDATLRMAGLSEVFTQDLEDMKPEQTEPPADRTARPTISAADHRRLEATIRDYGLDRERVKEWVRKACKVDHFPDLSPAQFEKLLVKLRQWADEEAQRLAYENAQIADAETDKCPF